MRAVWQYEYGRQIPALEPRKTKQQDEPAPVQEAEPVDPDAFRQIQQQKYPGKR